MKQFIKTCGFACELQTSYSSFYGSKWV